MRQLLLGLFLTTFSLCYGAPSPDQGVKELMDGNERFVTGKLLHPNRDQERRDKTAIAQKPFAIVLSCSDSRVSPEILFDQGIGDLFIIRIAGNVVGPTELASIGYAAHHLGSNILFVLGHENCGAVEAVLKGQTAGIEPIAKLIAPAIKKGSSLEAAVKDNVRAVVSQMKASSTLSGLIKQGKFTVVGGYYDLTSGTVKQINSSNDS